MASEYDKEYGQVDAEVFGKEFSGPIRARGYLEKCELIKIVKWKAARQQPNACRNDAALVRLVTQRAFAEDDERLAVWLLCYLDGVNVRMASAILTVFSPCRYTVMDYRASRSLAKVLKRLGLEMPAALCEANLDSPNMYQAYLTKCRCVARQLGIDLRTLDKYLWMLDKKSQ
jgi:hypothetical protein